jgi:hypothetical protein
LNEEHGCQGTRKTDPKDGKESRPSKIIKRKKDQVVQKYNAKYINVIPLPAFIIFMHTQ